MKLRPEQLGAHLSKNLAPLYVVHGDEPLLVQEAAAAIRDAARNRGYREREYLVVETGFDWNSWLMASNSLSLFTDRRLLELRLNTAKPGEAGSKALRAYAQRPPEDALLLVVCGKLDPASRWLTALEAAGVVVQVWPVDSRQLPAWIKNRMYRQGLQLTEEAVGLLAERVEGNLLAAAQEIEKLFVLFGASNVTAEQMLAVVSDSARYSIYDLVDAALAGHAGRTVRILDGLRGEGVEAILVSWALHREIRLLSLLNSEIGRGLPIEAALARNKVWEKRKSLVRRALQRLPTTTCRRLLHACAHVDCVLKGVEEGNPWDELLNLSLCLAGKELLTESKNY